jgi:hypothetical protein
MLRAALGVSMAVVATACQRDPSFTLSSGDSSAMVQLVDVGSAMTDLGSDADVLCVLQSVTQFGSGISDPEGGAADASSDAAASGASGPAPQIELYFDAADGHWHTLGAGPVTATVACAPWGAFGVDASLMRFDNGGGNPAGAGTEYVGLSATDCVLSNIEGDFSAQGNGAVVVDGGFTVNDPALDGIYASATCFGTSVPFADYTIDARSGTLDVAVAPPGEALCGLAALDSLTTPTSSIVVAAGHALGTHVGATVRCFSFRGTGDAR